MRKSSFFFSIIYFSLLLVPSLKGEDLNPPCPKGKSTWFCYGFKLTNIFDLGSTIGACASENGSIAKNEVAAFAVDFTLKKFDSKSRNEVRKDLYKILQNDNNYSIKKRVESKINNSGGCSVVLTKYYPSFSKPRPKPSSTIRDTMSDTPFQW